MTLQRFRHSNGSLGQADPDWPWIIQPGYPSLNMTTFFILQLNTPYQEQMTLHQNRKKGYTIAKPKAIAKRMHSDEYNHN